MAEAEIAAGKPRIERDVRDERAEFGLGHAVVHGAAQVGRQLIIAPHRCQCSYGNEAAVAFREVRVFPHRIVEGMLDEGGKLWRESGAPPRAGW